jgi:hypothetical protein
MPGNSTVSIRSGNSIAAPESSETDVSHARRPQGENPYHHLDRQRRNAIDGRFAGLPTSGETTSRAGFAYAPSEMSSIASMTATPLRSHPARSFGDDGDVLLHPPGQRVALSGAESPWSVREMPSWEPRRDSDAESSRSSSVDVWEDRSWHRNVGGAGDRPYRRDGYAPLLGGQGRWQSRDPEFGAGIDTPGTSLASSDDPPRPDASVPPPAPADPNFRWGVGKLPSDAVLEAHVRRTMQPLDVEVFRQSRLERQQALLKSEVGALRQQHHDGDERADGAPLRPWDRGYQPDRSELEAHALHDVIEHRSPAEVRAFRGLSGPEQREAIDHEVTRLQKTRQALPADQVGATDGGSASPLALRYPWEAGNPPRPPSDRQLADWVRHVAIPSQGAQTREKFARLPPHEQDRVVAELTRPLAIERDKLWTRYQVDESQRQLQRAQLFQQLNSAWMTFETSLVSAMANVLKSIGHAIENASRRG